MRNLLLSVIAGLIFLSCASHDSGVIIRRGESLDYCGLNFKLMKTEGDSAHFVVTSPKETYGYCFAHAVNHYLPHDPSIQTVVDVFEDSVKFYPKSGQSLFLPY
ncbi:MAG: hypothetical protein NTX24_04420 [Candidatus Pacearchaeota archaeon]|nr:hypothetical protein [Candidatus Pacearchaeota archaeon]